MPDSIILLGVIGRPHGVRGLVHVTSYTADPEDLTAYGVLADTSGRHFSLSWRAVGVAEISEIVDGRAVKITDREAAARLTNTRLFVARDRLPPAGKEEFYLADLIGLDAVDGAGQALGRVAAVHDYGAGTSLEIGRAAGDNLLVPFTRAAVPEVDVSAGRLVVNPPDEIVVPERAEAAE
jgi:16S rRNA processing protein RimM